MSGHQRDVGMVVRRRLQRLLHRPAGRVVDVDDAAMAVAALAGEVQRCLSVGLNGTPSSTSRSIACGRILDDELDRLRGC